MARTVNDAKLESREARRKLTRDDGKPHYRAIDEGLHLGYRRGKTGGKWVMRWYVGKQEYKVETIATADDLGDPDGVAILSFAQAQTQCRKLFTVRKREQAGMPADAGPYTVRQCVEDYLAWMDGNRKSAAEAHNRASAILTQLGDKVAARLTAEEIARWLEQIAAAPARVRTKKGAAPRFRDMSKHSDSEVKRRRRSSANRTLTVLKAALNRAWRNKKVPTDDEWRRVEPFKGADAARVRYLTIEEAKRLINASAPDFRRLVQAALATGARYGELAALTVGDFNPDSGTLQIRESKSGNPRHIVLNDEGVKIFGALTAGRAPDEPMLTKDGGARWLPSHQARPMAAACKAAKITPPANFHALRHSYASLAVMKGAPLLVVAKNLGHEDTRMVEKHYGHLTSGFIRDAIRKAAPTFGFKPDRKVVRARVAAS